MGIKKNLKKSVLKKITSFFYVLRINFGKYFFHGVKKKMKKKKKSKNDIINFFSKYHFLISVIFSNYVHIKCFLVDLYNLFFLLFNGSV